MSDAIEAAARAYYQVRPLHYVFKGGVSTPVSWEKMLSSKDSVRVDSVRRHREAIKAALQAATDAPGTSDARPDR